MLGGFFANSLGASAAGFPFRSASDASTDRSYFGRTADGSVLFANSGKYGMTTQLDSRDGSFVRVSSFKDNETIQVSSRVANQLIISEFSRRRDSQAFDLVAVTRKSLGILMYSDDGSFDEVTSSAPAAKKNVSSTCSDSLVQQVSGLIGSLSSSGDCKDYASDIRALAEKIAPVSTESSQVSCLKKIGYEETATKVTGLLTAESNIHPICDAKAVSNFDKAKSQLTFGSEVLVASGIRRENAFFHELLHVSGIESEVETKALTACCSSGRSDKSSCEIAELIKRAETKLSPVREILLAYFRSEQVPNMQKKRIGDSYFKADDIFLSKERCSVPGAASAAVRSLSETATSMCNATPDSSCKSELQQLKSTFSARAEECQRGQVLVTKLANADQKVGSALAVPATSAKAPTQVVLPQALTYRPETTEPAAVRREVERIRQPLMAAREYGSGIARTIVANMGNTAYAAESRLPRRVSKTEWSSSVKSVDPKSGRVTLDLGTNEKGQTLTASASMAFDGSTFSSPQVSVQAEPAVSRATSNRTAGAAVSARVDVSEATRAEAKGSATSIPGRVARQQQQASTPSKQMAAADEPGAPVYTRSDSPQTSSGAAGGGSPTRSIADTPTVSASALKRMLVRSNSPDAIIRDHTEDLKANGMQVRYRCARYPRDFKGTQLFDLDAYQGRKCGSQ